MRSVTKDGIDIVTGLSKPFLLSFRLDPKNRSRKEGSHTLMTPSILIKRWMLKSALLCGMFLKQTLSVVKASLKKYHKSEDDLGVCLLLLNKTYTVGAVVSGCNLLDFSFWSRGKNAGYSF